MPDRRTCQALFLGAVALYFSAGALQLSVGNLSRFGPGLFPLVVSSALMALAVISLVRARVTPSEPLAFRGRNMAIVLLALLAFVWLAKLLDLAAAIAALVFIAAAAGRSYSPKRNAIASGALIVVAATFQLLLGLRLHVL